jgi:hypothetical protein
MASMPFSTTDWLNLTPLDAITDAPVVGQKMWWVYRSESDSEMKMHIVTVTAYSDNGSTITFDSGESLEVHETFPTHITIHNGIVAKSRGEADAADMDIGPEHAADGNALPSAGKESTVVPTLLNDPPHQSAPAESAGEDAGGEPSLSNDPQEQTASANSAGVVAGVAVNRPAGNAAAVLASMIQHPPPPPPFTMPISANEVSLAQARVLRRSRKLTKRRERNENAKKTPVCLPMLMT